MTESTSTPAATEPCPGCSQFEGSHPDFTGVVPVGDGTFVECMTCGGETVVIAGTQEAPGPQFSCGESGVVENWTPPAK